MNPVKRFITILIILVLFAPIPLLANFDVPDREPLTLYEYYSQRGETLPSVSERAITAAQVGIFSYRGTYEQNVNLLKILLDKDNSLGYSVITNYKTTLAASMSSTQNTMKVSSVTTKDGHTITTADVGGIAYFVIEPGGNREEIVRSTGVSGSFWVGLTRGLAFYGTSTSEVAANRKSHNAGAIVVMSNVHFTFDQFVDTSADETISGTKTFINSPFVPTPTLGGQAANKSYVDFGLNQGAATSTETQVGIVQLSTPAEQASNDFDAANPQALSTKYASSTPGANFVVVSNASSTIDSGWIDTTANYTYTSDNFTVGGKNLVTEIPAPKFGGDGSDGALNISGGTTTINASNASFIIKNYTSISITSTGSLDFINPNTYGTLVILKSKGDCILTSSATPMIDMSAMGAKGGSGGSIGSATYTDGDDSELLISASTHGGHHGNIAGAGGLGGEIFENLGLYTSSAGLLQRKAIFIAAGSGGGGGANGRSTGGSPGQRGGVGGRGGGALLIECAGSLNFQGQISVNGEDGEKAPNATGTGGGGGGGGGGAGMAIILYNTLISNTGTILSAGGNGGQGGKWVSGLSGGSIGSGSGGGGGGAYGGAGGAGGAGQGAVSIPIYGGGGGGGAGQGGNGSVGVDGASNGAGGAGGASGSDTWVIKNTVF